MSKGLRIGEGKKRLIAQAYVSGLPVEEIAQAHHVTVGAIGRLRREDEAYQEMEKDLAGVLVEEAQRKLRSLIGKAIEVLVEIATLDHATTPQEAGKILTERRRAAGDLLKWAGELRALGEEPVDVTEALIDKVIQQQMMRSLERNDQQRETHGQSYGPPIPPPHLFRKPGDELPE